MSETDFWKIIALLNWKKVGDDDAVLKPAVQALSAWPPGEIENFSEIMAEKLYELDGELYARNCGDVSYRGENHHFSVDMFLYVRCCVVANGRRIFNGIRKNPHEMPKDVDFEPLLDLPALAYKKKTGKEFNYVTKKSFETFSNEELWAHVDTTKARRRGVRK